MSDAPEWIWAYTGDGSGDRMTDYGTWDIGDMDGIPDCHRHWPHVKYVRADLVPTDEQIMANHKVRALMVAVSVQARLLREGCAGERGRIIGERLDAALRDLKGGEW